MDIKEYPFEIKPLSPADGGGYLISFPDFSECISDGETPEDAIRNGYDALRETIAALEEKLAAIGSLTARLAAVEKSLAKPHEVATLLSHA